MDEAFVGRQAIYDSRMGVHGYEILFRDRSDSDRAEVVNGDMATSRVVLNTFLELGASRVVGDRPAFINLTRPFLTGSLPLPLPADRVVAEVLEDILPDPALIAGIRRLRAEGMRIALDDYIHRPDLIPLVKLADYVKVDIQAQSREEVAKAVRQLREFDVQLLAEKIETFEEFEFCEELGFEYFQGYFLTRPVIVRGRRVPANRMNLLRILGRLADPDVEFDELRSLIEDDVALGLKLLQLVNSALHGLRTKIEAVHQTLVILGQERVRRTVSLLLLARFDDKPVELLFTALRRAHMCAAIARRENTPNHDAYFTAGLLSILDALLGQPMDVVLEHLQLTDEIQDALLSEEGEMGRVLLCVRAYERGDWDNVDCGKLSVEQIRSAYFEAVEHAASFELEENGTGLAA